MSQATKLYLEHIQNYFIESGVLVVVLCIVEYLPILYHSILSAFFISKYSPPEYFLKYLKYISYDGVISEYINDDENIYFLGFIALILIYYNAYRNFLIRFIKHEHINAFTIIFYELFFFRIFAITFIDSEVKGILAVSHVSSIISVILLVLTFSNFGLAYIRESMYLNFTDTKSYFFNNYLVTQYEIYFLIIKIAICFNRSLEYHKGPHSSSIVSFLNFAIVMINCLFFFMIISFLNIQKFSFLNHTILNIKFFQSCFICTVSVAVIIMKRFNNLFFCLIVINGIIFSIYFFKAAKAFCYNKIFKEGYELSAMLYIFNTNGDDAFKEKIMDQIIEHHKVDCQGKNCSLCSSLLRPDDKKKENKYFKHFLKAYHQYVKNKCKELASQDEVENSYFLLIEMYYSFYSKKEKFFQTAFKYHQICSLYKKSKKGIQSKNHKSMNFLFNFMVNLSMIYKLLIKKVWNSENEVKKNYYMKINFITIYINTFFKKLKYFLSLKLRSPKNIIELSSYFSELKKKTNFDFLTTKENRYTYQSVICQYVLENIYNGKTNETIFITGNISTFDELLSYKFTEDKIILSLVNLEALSIQINQCGKEINHYKGESFFKLFPPFLSAEGKKRVMEALSSSKINQMDYYFNKIETGTYEAISFNFLTLPHLDINNYDELYSLSSYRIEKERILFFEKKQIAYRTEIVLVGLSEYAAVHLHLNSSILKYSLDNSQYIKFEDILSKNGTVNLKKILQKLKKIFPFEKFPAIPAHTKKFEMRLKEEINEKYLVYYLGELNKNSKDINTTIEMTSKKEKTLNTFVTDLDINFDTATGMSSSCMTRSSVSAYINEAKELKEEKNTQYKQFYKYVYYILGFNVAILILVAIFLTVSLINNIYLNNFFGILTNFNDFQCYFYHSSLSIFSLSCNSDYVEQIDCMNQFKIISEDFIASNQLTSNEMLSEYVSRELQVKSVYVLSTLNTWTNDKNQISSKDIDEITKEDFEFYIISEVAAKIYSEPVYISFSDAVKNYVNMINFLSIDKAYLTSPVFIISIDGNSLVDLSNVVAEKTPINGSYLNDSQRYYYTMLINFQKYIRKLLKIGELLYDLYQSEILKTKNMIIIFSIVFVFAHILMFAVIMIFTFKFKELHKEYYYMIYDQLSSEKFMEYFNNKMSKLSTLTNLYKENPNNIILSLDKLKKKEFQRKTNLLKLKTHEEKRDEAPINKSMINRIYNKLLFFRYISKIAALFVIYYVIFIILLFVLFGRIYRLKKMNNYTKNNNDVSNYLYLNLCLTQMMSLTNQTDFDFYKFLSDTGDEAKDIELGIKTSENFVKNKIQELLENVKTINELETRYDYFTSFTSQIEIDCDTFYQNIDDELIEEVLDTYPESDYYKMLSEYCRSFPSIKSYKDDKLSLEVISYQTSQLLDYFVSRTFEKLAEINNSDLLYTLYGEILLIMRPIRTFIRKFLKNHIIDKILGDYSVLTVIFILFNFLYDLIILGFLKIYLIDIIICKSKEMMTVAQSIECF